MEKTETKIQTHQRPFALTLVLIFVFFQALGQGIKPLLGLIEALQTAKPQEQILEHIFSLFSASLACICIVLLLKWKKEGVYLFFLMLIVGIVDMFSENDQLIYFSLAGIIIIYLAYKITKRLRTGRYLTIF